MTVVLGIIMLLGFFLFPVLHSELAELIGQIASLFNEAKNVSALKLILVAGKDLGGVKGYQIYGYSSRIQCFGLFLIPAIAALAMILFGCFGKKEGGIGTICAGSLSLLLYILQVATFPVYGIGATYSFTFWQWLLMGLAIAAIAGGVLELVSTIRYERSSGEYYGDMQTTGFGGSADRHDGKGGYLQGISGEYAGATITMQPGVRITIGRNPDECNLVLADPMVSRIHCYVSYQADINVYIVMDVSKYGIYDAHGNVIEKNVDVYMGSGDQIRIGQTQNVFILG